MIRSIVDGKKIAEREINKGVVEPLVVTSGFKARDGFVYSYDYKDKKLKSPTEGLDDPFVWVRANGEVIHYSPFENPKEFKEGQKHLVRFR